MTVKTEKLPEVILWDHWPVLIATRRWKSPQASNWRPTVVVVQRRSRWHWELPLKSTSKWATTLVPMMTVGRHSLRDNFQETWSTPSFPSACRCLEASWLRSTAGRWTLASTSCIGSKDKQIFKAAWKAPWRLVELSSGVVRRWDGRPALVFPGHLGQSATPATPALQNSQISLRICAPLLPLVLVWSWTSETRQCQKCQAAWISVFWG